MTPERDGAGESNPRRPVSSIHRLHSQPIRHQADGADADSAARAESIVRTIRAGRADDPGVRLALARLAGRLAADLVAETDSAEEEVAA